MNKKANEKSEQEKQRPVCAPTGDESDFNLKSSFNTAQAGILTSLCPFPSSHSSVDEQ
jgi:hypothetical protein